MKADSNENKDYKLASAE